MELIVRFIVASAITDSSLMECNMTPNAHITIYLKSPNKVQTTRETFMTWWPIPVAVAVLFAVVAWVIWVERKRK
jgi:glucan phosphoethanolaminetransferase (alkaline phosphatase superfamily)